MDNAVASIKEIISNCIDIRNNSILSELKEKVYFNDALKILNDKIISILNFIIKNYAI